MRLLSLRLLHATHSPKLPQLESWGLLSAIQPRLIASRLNTIYLYRVHTLIIFADMDDIYVTIIRQLYYVLRYTATCVYVISMRDVAHVRLRYHLNNAI